MSIAQQIFLRYRVEGHLRFVVPEELCSPEAVQQIEQGLKDAEGVYRVKLYPHQGKLSIRYIEGVTNFKLVVRALREIVARTHIAPPTPSCCAGKNLARTEEPVMQAGIGGWAKSKYHQAKETLAAMGIISRPSGAKPPFTRENEQFVIDFLTDILVLYLIKLHWHMILHEWLKRPWQYRNEWMATVYMIFLLVRSKKPK